MKNKTLIILLLIVFFSSCNKKSDDPTYTVSGHIYEDCNMQPITNTLIQIMQGGSGFLASTTTDANGYFILEFQDLSRDFEKILIKEAGGYNEIMLDIPCQTNIDNLVLYKSSTTNIKVSLNVLNPHSLNDTLVINDYRTGQNLSIPGPFVSGTIYTVSNYQLLIMHYGGESKRLSWAFYPNNGSQFDTYFLVNKFCNDTIYVNVDIN